MSIDRISIGLRLKNIIQKGAPRDVLSAARLLLANWGEVTDAASTKVNVSVQQSERLIIYGVSKEEAEKLFNGYSQAPQLEAENPDPGKAAPEEKVIDVQAKERYFGFTRDELDRVGCQPFETEYFVKHQGECKRGDTCDECSKIKRSLTARQHAESTRYAIA